MGMWGGTSGTCLSNVILYVISDLMGTIELVLD